MLELSDIQSSQEELQEYYAQLGAQHVTPAWIGGGISIEPRSAAVPHLHNSLSQPGQWVTICIIRRELLKMLDRLAPSDVMTVTRIDRLARSTFDLFGIVKSIVDAKAQFRSLAEPWADTGTSTGRLMLAVLGGLADVERDLVRTRTAEGRSRAKAQGKHMGGPLPHTRQTERGH